MIPCLRFQEINCLKGQKKIHLGLYNEILRDFSLKVCQDFVCKIWVKTLFQLWPPGGASAVNTYRNVNKSSFRGHFLGTRPRIPCNTCPSKQCLTLSIFEIDPTYGYEFDFS